MNVDHAVITELLELGRKGEDRVPPALADPESAWSFLQRDPAVWEEAGRELPEEQLRLLIRGLVHYSRARGPVAVGLSVSPVISLFSSYSERFRDERHSLTKWIVANRVNPYEPFGSFDW
jgi:hypothetical protein